jgi:hypothetical protein
MKMALLMPLVMGLALIWSQFNRSKQEVPEFVTSLIPTLAVLVGAFSMAPTMSNAFGLDRNGFRSLVLLPTPRHHILLAKNLSFFPFVGGIALGLLVLAKFFMRLPWGAALAGLLKAPVAFLLFSLACNLVSIYAPYRFAAGTLKAKKPKAVTILAVFITLFLLPLVMIPLLVPTGLQVLFSSQGWAPGLPVNLLATCGILAGVAWIYRLLLPLEGRLLQRREQAILKEVTEEVE